MITAYYNLIPEKIYPMFTLSAGKWTGKVSFITVNLRRIFNYKRNRIKLNMLFV